MKIPLIAAVFFAITVISQAQSVGINSDGSSPNGSAMLDVSSTTKGFLPPRMTKAQRNAISSPSPANGLLIFQTDSVPGYYYYNGTSWIDISNRATGINAGDMQYWNGIAWVKIPAGSPGQFLQFSVSEVPEWTGAVFPAVTTSSVSSIGYGSATSGGNVTNDGGELDIVRGVCWSTTGSPTIADSKITSGTGSGTYICVVTGLTSNTTYYIRAFATNAAGTVYGDQNSFTTLTTPIVGESFQGGKIAYILQSGDPGYVLGEIHGLIAAPSDQSTGASWGCSGTSISGTSMLLGTGQANTTLIVNGCSTAGIAARLCDDLELNGYTDWYLPSLNEIIKLFNNREIIGGFDTVSGIYWTSYEGSSTQAMEKDFFGYGNQTFPLKSTLLRVRAVRSFVLQ